MAKITNSTMADKLKDAFASKGESPPKLDTIQSHASNPSRWKQFNQKVQPLAVQQNRQKFEIRQVKSSPNPAVPVLHRPVVAEPIKPAKPSPPSVTIKISDRARLAIAELESVASRLLANMEANGRAEQCYAANQSGRPEREVAIGLDFGTSSVKVVIGDFGSTLAYAVPFCNEDGIGHYLLPSRLYEEGGAFSLYEGNEIHSDLKLSLLAEPANEIFQQRVVGFLALVIRQARGWLFTEHLDDYRNTHIRWKLVLGLPTAFHLEDELSRLFRRIALAAWIAAAMEKDISQDIAAMAIAMAERGSTNIPNDVEVDVVPEIAAQIYGFVSSTSFDKNAANHYLMVDVGAGTIDASLFHVKRGKGGRWNFEFYTSVVEPNGAMNLHRDRVNWWQEQLTVGSAPKDLIDSLSRVKFATDQQFAIPESYEVYFEGIEAVFANKVLTPDHEFFMKRVVSQVRGKSYWRAGHENFLLPQQLRGIPVYLCGGGMRMKFYDALEAQLKHAPGVSWLQANRRSLDVPWNLIAEGLLPAEYDRLSVAYGLSLLEVGSVIRSLPLPKVTEEVIFDDWRSNYVDKDQT